MSHRSASAFTGKSDAHPDLAAHVIAVSAPRNQGWRWRIVSASAQVLQESREHHRTVADAVAAGWRHLATMPDARADHPRTGMPQDPHGVTPRKARVRLAFIVLSGMLLFGLLDLWVAMLLHIFD